LQTIHFKEHSMSLRFLTIMFLAIIGSSALNGAARADDAAVSGVFKGNGKDAKLAFVSARKGDKLSDKPTIKLVFTEKDHSKDKRADYKAMYGDFGSALIITVFEDGKIVGCEVAHKAHEKMGFSSLGSINMTDFKMKDGKLTGVIKTDGEVKTFGETWEVNFKFTAKAP
jgi:hypothetical protein